jgi:hypothetical protein
MYLSGCQPATARSLYPATPASILDDLDTYVTSRVNHMIREALRIIWHQR